MGYSRQQDALILCIVAISLWVEPAGLLWQWASDGFRSLTYYAFDSSKALAVPLELAAGCWAIGMARVLTKSK